MVFHRSKPSPVTLGPNPDPDPLTFLYDLIALRNPLHAIAIEILCSLNTIFVGLGHVYRFGDIRL